MNLTHHYNLKPRKNTLTSKRKIDKRKNTKTTEFQQNPKKAKVQKTTLDINNSKIHTTNAQHKKHNTKTQLILNGKPNKPKTSKTNKIVSKRQEQRKRLSNIIVTPQKFHVNPPSLHQLWKCIQPNDLHNIIEHYYKPFGLQYFGILLYEIRHVLCLQPAQDLNIFNSCQHYALQMSDDIKNHYILKYGKSFVRSRNYLFYEFLTKHREHVMSLFSATLPHYYKVQQVPFQERQSYRKEAMSSALICFQYRIPLLDHIFITKINKTKLIASNGCIYHLDMCRRGKNNHFRFTQSRWNFESMPVLCIHQCTCVILQCLYQKCKRHVFGFFKDILELAGCIGILMEPNSHRRSAEIIPSKQNWNLFVQNYLTSKLTIL